MNEPEALSERSSLAMRMLHRIASRFWYTTRLLIPWIFAPVFAAIAFFSVYATLSFFDLIVLSALGEPSTVPDYYYLTANGWLSFFAALFSSYASGHELADDLLGVSVLSDATRLALAVAVAVAMATAGPRFYPGFAGRFRNLPSLRWFIVGATLLVGLTWAFLALGLVVMTALSALIIDQWGFSGPIALRVIPLSPLALIAPLALSSVRRAGTGAYYALGNNRWLLRLADFLYLIPPEQRQAILLDPYRLDLEFPHSGLAAVGDLPLHAPPGEARGWRQADELLNMIVNGREQQTIVVSGDWGSGKTSLMRVVMGRLGRYDSERRYATVWFNAWRFQAEQDLVVPLLATIEQDLQVGGWFGRTGSSHARRTLRRLTMALVQGWSFGVGPVAVNGPNIARAFVESERDGETDAGRYFGFTEQMRRLVEQLGGNDEVRLVVFVDDLDRCLPESMFRTMEQLKLFFDVPGVVFVVGVSLDALHQSVTLHYPGAEEYSSGTLADRYLEKIIQGRIRVQRVPAIESAEVWSGLTGCTFALSEGSEPSDYVQLLAQYLTYFRVITPRAANLWLDELDAFVHRCIELDTDITSPDEACERALPFLASLGPIMYGVAADEDDIPPSTLKEKTQTFWGHYSRPGPDSEGAEIAMRAYREFAVPTVVALAAKVGDPIDEDSPVIRPR